MDRLREADARIEAERLGQYVPESQEDAPQATEPPAIMAAMERLERAQQAYRASNTAKERDTAGQEINAAARELKELRRRDG